MRRFRFVVSTPIGGLAERYLAVEVRTEARARELAETMLARSPEHSTIEVWEGERQLFTVARSPDGGAGKPPDASGV